MNTPVKPQGFNVLVVTVILDGKKKSRVGVVVELGSRVTDAKVGDVVQWVRQNERNVNFLTLPYCVFPERDIICKVTDHYTLLRVKAQYREMVGDPVGAKAYRDQIEAIRQRLVAEMGKATVTHEVIERTEVVDEATGRVLYTTNQKSEGERG